MKHISDELMLLATMEHISGELILLAGFSLQTAALYAISDAFLTEKPPATTTPTEPAPVPHTPILRSPVAGVCFSVSRSRRVV